MNTDGHRFRQSDNPRFRGSGMGVRLWLLMLAIVGIAWGAFLHSAQTTASSEDPPPNDLALEEILERNAAHRKKAGAKLKAYTGRRTYRLWNHGLNQKASAVVEVRYTSEKGPEFKEISATGSGLLRNRVFGRIMREEQKFFSPEEMAKPLFREEDYQIEPASREKLDGVWCDVLKLTPRREETLLYQGRVWLDPQDFGIRKTEGTLVENPSFWTRRITFTHVNHRIDGI